MKDKLFHIFNNIICAIAFCAGIAIIPQWYYGNLASWLSICLLIVCAVTVIYTGFIAGCYEERAIRKYDKEYN